MILAIELIVQLLIQTFIYCIPFHISSLLRNFYILAATVPWYFFSYFILCTYLMQPPKIGSRKKKSVNARPLIPLCLGPFSSLPCHINCYILARPEPKSEIISLALTYWETFSSINGSIHNMKSYCCSQLYWLTDDYFCITLLVLYVLL